MINGLENITFTNDLGTLEFQRAMVSYVDSWEWNGRSVTASKAIEVDAWIKRTDPGGDRETPDTILTSESNGLGHRGTLTLPWVTLTNIAPESIDIPNSAYLDFVPVRARFRDDQPDQNTYSVSFFDLKLYNPQFNVPVLWRPLFEEYAQQPVGNSVGLLDESSPSYSPMRTQAPWSIMPLVLSGTCLMDEIPALISGTKIAAGSLSPMPVNHQMDFLVDTLSQRHGSSNETITGGAGVGLPRTFRLSECSPELATDMDIRHLFVRESRAAWDVESGSVQVTINMLAQPHKYLGGV